MCALCAHTAFLPFVLTLIPYDANNGDVPSIYTYYHWFGWLHNFHPRYWTSIPSNSISDEEYSARIIQIYVNSASFHHMSITWEGRQHQSFADTHDCQWESHPRHVNLESTAHPFVHMLFFSCHFMHLISSFIIPVLCSQLPFLHKKTVWVNSCGHNKFHDNVTLVCGWSTQNDFPSSMWLFVSCEFKKRI